MALQNPLIYKDNAHKPLDPATDQVSPYAIALSAVPDNLIQPRSNGLYVGPNSVGTSRVYVAASGTDADGFGTKAAPLKTLDYALTQAALVNLRFPGSTFVIALKAGETFALTGRQFIPALSNLTITFYGDAVYGDYDSPLINGTTLPALMATLSRPVINQVITQSNGKYISNGFNNGTLRLEGVQINLAAAPAGPPPNTNYGMMDFFYISSGAGSVLDLVGAIVNRADANSVGGIYGVGGRSRGTLRQIATQFQIAGVPANAAAGLTASQLASRIHFLHLYLDYPGADTREYSNPVFPSSATSSNGTGLTDLLWSDTTLGTLPQGNTLTSFPLLSDVQFGFRNYITGLIRDQQQRPLNIISGRLF